MMMNLDIKTEKIRPLFFAVQPIQFEDLVEYARSSINKWWSGRELNPRHMDFQSIALPTELPDQAQPTNIRPHSERSQPKEC